MVPALVASTKSGELNGNGGYTGMVPSANFGGAFGINYIFTPANTVEGELKLYVWTAEDYENAETLTLENASDVLTMTEVGDGSYTARVTGISAKNAGDTVYVCGVYESEGVTYMTGVLEYSVSTYCKNLNSQEGTIKDLTAAAGVYTYYAREFLLQ